MDKTAQSKRQTGRGFFNKLRDLSNIPGEKLSGFFKPEHERVMKSLRDLDNLIRAEVTGSDVEGAKPATGINSSLKDLLKEARRNFNRNEFVSGISDLAAFHQKLNEVVKEINKFYIDVNKIHHKFLFEGTDDKKLQRMRSHMERKAELELALMMTKEAGIMDFLHNVATPRGRALSAWVKKYPKETKDLREKGMALVEHGQALYDATLGYLKQMATARAVRRPDDYMDAANKIKQEFTKFDSGKDGFTNYYNNVVMPFLKIKDEMDVKSQEAAKEQAKQEMAPPPEGRTELGQEGPTTVVTGPPSGMVPSAPATAPQTSLPGTLNQPPVPGALQNPPGASPPFAPPPDTVKEESGPDTERNPPSTVRSAHQRFMESLESMSGEDPRILAGYIAKYAKSIQSKDPEVAIELFSIVRQLRS